ncbi:DNA replication/repair protein RecF [Leekyejoonella antrihumi]|uniref:DNA replication and repair protein RecF n=1 Tax=Leekyejoonella antrihumi TaxID=1660198 RepID=A0A563E6T8_9MICO|nr:DNA replication/repair protein RecF [Leekyejoonella antrihumi]TWP38250.1 DNA replication/repair protein RecF [Leekyejoonella antrihumi]
MHLRHLTLADFRSYESAEVPLAPGITTFVGRNGQGKTNLVEAAYYLATLGSHRVAQDAPLVRAGAEQAIVRAAVMRAEREQRLELEINPGRANRGRLGKAPLGRPRELLGAVRTVMFAPEDLALVKADPAGRRRFLDELLVARQPRWAGARGDYDKILKQRNALLKSARGAPNRAAVLESLPVWDTHLAQVGANLIYARLRLMQDLQPYLATAYEEVSGGASDARTTYRSSLHGDLAQTIACGEVPQVEEIESAMHESFARQQAAEVDRGLTLVGPHRDDLELRLGALPAKGYASHGESWSFALGLKLAAFTLLRHDLDTDPVLILDDVFAELDAGRRERLAEMIGDAEQVLITAAVGADVPAQLTGATFEVVKGAVHPR